MKEWKSNLKKGIAQLLVLVVLISAMPITAYADTISGTGYSFDTETGLLYVKTEAGATAWRNDDRIAKEAVKQLEFQRLDTPVINIPDNAFEGCINLTGSIELNGEAISIGKDAFKDCDKIEQILIPLAAAADIAEAGISTNTAYIVYKKTGDFEIVVSDVFMGNQSKITFDGGLFFGEWSYSGITLVCKDEYQIDVIDVGSAWYYQGDGEEITITRYVPSNSPGANKNITLPKTLAGKTVVGYGTEIFADERFDASYVVSYEEGTNVVLPDKVSKCIITEEDEKKVAYLYKGSEGTLDIEMMNFDNDIAVIYAKDIIFSDRMMMHGRNTFFSYIQDAEGNVTITDVAFPELGMENDYNVPTTINGKPVTTVMINQYQKFYINEIVVDPTVNKIIYEFDTYSGGTSSPVIVKVTQGSEQKSVQIPSKFNDKAIEDVDSSVFDESVKCVVVNETTTVEVPTDVSKVIYEIESDGNVVITEVIAGIDGNGEKISVEIPEAIGGSKPEMSPEAREAMRDIPHEHKDNNCVCSPIIYNINLGTNGIIDPTEPTSASDAWKGSYVYFGTYNGTPVKYRVLDSNTTVFSADGITHTMFIDCDSILSSSDFGTNSNVWADSDIRTYLNGTFFTDNFSIAEQNAIVSSSKNEAYSGADGADGNGNPHMEFAPLSNDKIFLLDAKEASNESYGYSNTESSAANRVKTGGNFYWLRSAYTDNNINAGVVEMDGFLYFNSVYSYNVGVSPALNINLSSILFSSARGTSKSLALTANSNAIGTTTGTEWKLTLLDTGKTIAITSNEKIIRVADGTITVPYTYTDTATTDAEKANQISVMITDKAYTESDAKILYYGALQSTDFEDNSGTGTFVLPSGLDDKVMGTDYHVYILAEHVNTTNVTDYASVPVEITDVYDEISNVDISIDTPVGNQPFDTTAETTTTGIESIVVTWTDTEGNPITAEKANFYPWTYILNLTIKPEDGYVLSHAINVSMNNDSIACETLIWNPDGTCTVKSYDIISTKRELVRVDAPSLSDNRFSNFYDSKEEVLQGAVGNELTYSTIGHFADGGSADVSIEWSIVGEYNATPNAVNTFKWTATGLGDYNVPNSIVLEGTVEIRNRAYDVFEYTAEGFEGTYDGLEHGIEVEVVGDGAEITYSTDGVTYIATNPTFTDAGEYTVYYKIVGENYETVSGSKTVKIAKREIGVTAGNQSIVWGDVISQTAYTITGAGLIEGDTIILTLNASTTALTTNGTISVSGIKIVRGTGDAAVDVTANYAITTPVSGKLTISHDTTLAPTKIEVSKTTTSYIAGQSLNVDDITVTAFYADGYSEKVTGYTTNVRDLNMNQVGEKKLTVSYTKNGGTVNADITVSVTDVVAPTVEITVKDNKWTQLLNTITFGLFFNETQDVIITATDANSTVEKVYYYISREGLTEDEVKALSDTEWKTYTAKFSIDSDNKYVIYVKAVDSYNNTTYVSSNGMIIDKQVPVITGIEDGKTYYAEVTFGVTDAYLDKVLVDGKEVSLTDGKYTIYADDKEHTIKAIDKVGNETAYEIAVKSSVITYTATGYDGIYDGNSHGIKVNVTAPSDVKISYSTDKGADKTYSEENPVFKEIGEYTVYYKIEKENYVTVYGSSKLTIRHNETLPPVRIEVEKTKVNYVNGDSLNVDDITVTAFYADGYSEKVTGYTTNVRDLDMNVAGEKNLVVSYAKNGGTVNADITITVKYETTEKPPVEYEITDGANATILKDSNNNLSIRGTGALADFLYVKVDGTVLDKFYYTLKEGSTIVTLNEAYLDTLSVGIHDIELTWVNGSASANFEIKASDEPEIPDTGDSMPYGWYVTFLMGCGITAVGFWKKKKYIVEE